MPLILAEAPRDMGIGIRTALSLDLSRVMEIERLAFGGQWSYHEFKASLDDVFLVAVDAATASIVGFVVACCARSPGAALSSGWPSTRTIKARASLPSS